MQPNRGNMHPFFGFPDQFSGMGGFGGLGSHGSLLSSFFGRRDPFDDPFFKDPFGNMFGNNMADAHSFMGMPAYGFIEHDPQQPRKSKGPIIEEINSEEEEDDGKEEPESSEKKRSPSNPKKHLRSNKEPYVEDPDDESEVRHSKLLQHANMHRPDRNQLHPQTQSFSFQSSAVSYGGQGGTYYTSSSTRRTGSDGVTIEEKRDADSSSRRATHRVSRGIHNKGHSITRNLNSDGKVDTTQTLHNLNEDELSGFENAWSAKVGRQLPGWHGLENNGSGRDQGHVRGGRHVPSIEYTQNAGRHPVGKYRAGSSSRV